MKVSMNVCGINTTTNVDEKNIENLKDYIKLVSGNKETKIVKNVTVLSDPNPIISYVNDKRVKPGTDIYLNVIEKDWSTLLEEQNGVDLEYDINGYRMINLCDHDIGYKNPSTGEVIVLKPSGVHARLFTALGENPFGRGGTFKEELYMNVLNVPTPFHDIKFIVSRMVYDVLPDRVDIVAPNSFTKAKNGSVVTVDNFVARSGVIG